jgi:molybdopterin synthase catalytic subunit
MRPVSSTPSKNWVSVTSEQLSLDALSDWATRADCGAIVSFSGVVRNASSARNDVQALEYETSEELAERRLDQIIDEARRRWPTLGAVGIHHRTGRVKLSETTVLVVVSSPHRAEAFDAARYCIDTLKVSVPMWKRELFEGGSAWSEESSPIVNVENG